MSNRASLLILTLLLPSAVFSADTSLMWEVDKLLNNRGDQIVLRDDTGASIESVHRKQLEIISRVMTNIESASEIHPVLVLMQGTQPNAAAGLVKNRPTVLINFGMLNMIGNDEDQWAAILGHEVAHLKLDHSRKSLNRRVPLKIAELLIKLSTNNEWSHIATDVFTKVIDTKYSRDQERQSDYLGVIWSVEGGYDPRAAVTVHKELGKISKGRPLPFLSSHPSSKERMVTLEKMADRLYRPPIESPPEISKVLQVAQTTRVINPISKSEMLKTGMYQETVLQVMGVPITKEFQGDGAEWHYCETGSAMDEFVAVIFEQGALTQLKRYTVTASNSGLTGDCTRNIKRGTYK
jgi:Zn-dependent protease with chaperone function